MADGNQKTPVHGVHWGFSQRRRRWPTLPRSLDRSTIGAVGLNDRVRDGNGCGPYALIASETASGARQAVRPTEEQSEGGGWEIRGSWLAWARSRCEARQWVFCGD